MVPEDRLSRGEFRLLEVDNRLVLPLETQVRAVVTAADVLHSWAIPAIGVKLDAVPGRLNQVPLLIEFPGLFYGQCSEICGANHRFMPICLESVPTGIFLNWLKTYN